MWSSFYIITDITPKQLGWNQTKWLPLCRVSDAENQNESPFSIVNVTFGSNVVFPISRLGYKHGGSGIYWNRNEIYNVYHIKYQHVKGFPRPPRKPQTWRTPKPHNHHGHRHFLSFFSFLSPLKHVQPVLAATFLLVYRSINLPPSTWLMRGTERERGTQNKWGSFVIKLLLQH